MLILRRKSGESIVIGDDITLAVLDINEGSVRLAIDAPKSITILRSELLQAADANRDSVAGMSPSRGLLQLMEGRQGLNGGARRRPGKLGAAGRVPATTSGATSSTPDPGAASPTPDPGAASSAQNSGALS